MKFKAGLGILFTFLFSALSAQQIRITDEATQRPVSDVFIYHENKANVAYTDDSGRADLSKFPSGLIFVQHPSYYEKSIAYLGSDLSLSISEKIVAFSEVVISANKWEQKEEQVSQQIISIGKKSVEFQNPQTSADLLDASGQVFVQKSQQGGGSPKLRGFAANAVLIVVDGVRMNNAIFRGGNLQNVINVDPNALESSEVIFGPGSVIYGSDALGGVMDFHTVSPNWSSNKKPIVTGGVFTRYSSAANERTGHLDLSVSKRRFTFFHSTSFSALDDLRAGNRRSSRYRGEFERRFFAQRIDGEDQLVANEDFNVQKFSGFNLFNTINKIKFRIGENMDIGYGFYYSTTSDIPRYDNLTETIGETDSLESAEWYYGPQQWQMHNLRVNLYQSTSFFDQAKMTVAYQGFEESRNDRDFGDDRLRTRTENVDMYTLSLDFDKEYSRSNLYYGFDFFHNDVASSAFRKNIENGEISRASTRYPEGGSQFSSAAIYGSWVYNITDEIVLNAGLRYNHVALSAKTLDSAAQANDSDIIDISNSAVNGALGLVWNMTERQKFSYNFSSGFRSPNVDDVAKFFEVGDNLRVPNTELKPEYTFSNELSYEVRTGSAFLRVVGFYSRLIDAILDGPYTFNGQTELDGLNVIAKVNAAEAETYGLSFVLKAELSKAFAVEQTLSFVNGSDLTNGEPLRHATPIFGRTSLVHRYQRIRTEFMINYNGNRNRDQIPSTEIDGKPHLYTATGSPGWYTLNLRTSYQINEYLKANAGIENILDQHYRPYSSGISAPGRNILLALRANF